VVGRRGVLREGHDDQEVSLSPKTPSTHIENLP
jgi:hypothetical protein